MKPSRNLPGLDFRVIIATLALVLSSLACGLVQQTKATPTRTPGIRYFPTVIPTKTQEPTQSKIDLGDLVHLWATTGEASSEYGSSAWSALQAGGAPDTPECGDAGTAWAAAQSDSVESITVYYMDQPLIPAEINIVQSYNPSQVVKVELLDAYSEHSDFVIYEAEPKTTDKCPYTLSIPVTGIEYLVMGVRITIDQTVLGLGWNEIDAVELVGYAEAGVQPQPTDSGMPEGVWDNAYALPIFPTAQNVNYVDDFNLIYSVSGSTRQDVLDFLFTNLDSIGWRLDVDENGKCLDANRCQSKSEGLDYKSSTNQMWYFIHTDSPDAYLSLSVVPNNGSWSVGMSLK